MKKDKIFKILENVFVVFLVFIIFYLSIIWADFSKIYNVKEIKINGVNYFNKNLIEDKNIDFLGQNILSINLVSLKNDIKDFDHIVDCKISRKFPSSVSINIVERVPVAMINTDELIILDSEGICLPVEHCDIPLPILSNYRKNPELYPKGKKTNSTNVMKSIEVITYTKQNFEELYKNISEFYFNENNEYEIILKNGRTKIVLGSNNFFKKINNLNAFTTSIEKENKLTDFSYVDLRYEEQVVVREL